MDPKKLISALLTAALLLAPTLASCGEKAQNSGETSAQSESSAGTEEQNILDTLNYDGREFRIQMSKTDISSADFMEGLGESTGDVAYDAAYERNLTVAEKLGVSFVYTDTNYNWDKVAENVRKLILSGDDAFELIVNDQIGLAALSVEKMFINVNDCQYFNFDKNGWWGDYMRDLTIGNKEMYLLVGDYFIDVLRKSHVIYYNRTLFENLFGDPDAVYQSVNDGKWTFGSMLDYINAGYSDIDGDGKITKGDRFGMLIAGVGGSIFPYEYAGAPDFIERDENGIPSITMQNERSDKLYQAIYSIFYSEATYTGYTEHAADLYAKFKGDGSLFLSTVSIGDFEALRDMESDVGILPYPKLDEAQDGYYTTIHDTAEIGAIPMTSADPDYASAVIQALCEESNKTMTPAYYETALKIKYVRDNYSAQMIDTIYGGIKGLFPLVYGSTYANNIFTWAFLEPLQKKTETWVSSYESRIEAARTQLQSLIDAYMS